MSANIDEKQLEMDGVYFDGYAAFGGRKRESDNPHLQGTPEAAAWLEGFQDGWLDEDNEQPA